MDEETGNIGINVSVTEYEDIQDSIYTVIDSRSGEMTKLCDLSNLLVVP